MPRQVQGHGWQQNEADDNGSQVHLKCNDLTLSSQLIPSPCKMNMSQCCNMAHRRRPRNADEHVEKIDIAWTSLYVSIYVYIIYMYVLNT